jgi:hypothetical protein
MVNKSILGNQQPSSNILNHAMNKFKENNNTKFIGEGNEEVK